MDLLLVVGEHGGLMHNCGLHFVLCLSAVCLFFPFHDALYLFYGLDLPFQSLVLLPVVRDCFCHLPDAILDG